MVGGIVPLPLTQVLVRLFLVVGQMLQSQISALPLQVVFKCLSVNFTVTITGKT